MLLYANSNNSTYKNLFIEEDQCVRPLILLMYIHNTTNINYGINMQVVRYYQTDLDKH